MPIVQALDGKKLSLILAQPKCVSVFDCAVLTGIARWRGGHLFLDRGRHFLDLQVPDEVVSRIQRIAPELRGILYGAEYMVSISPSAPPVHDVEPRPQNTIAKRECFEGALQLSAAT